MKEIAEAKVRIQFVPNQNMRGLGREILWLVIQQIIWVWHCLSSHAAAEHIG